ncbi:MAG: hypothetical protein ACYTDV_11920, partial [Planctomycetota bacterium]
MSTTYINAKRRLIWECADGHVWEAPPDRIQQGKWCPHCAGVAKKSIDDMRRLAESRGGKCLSGEYSRITERLLWECADGHVWKATGRDIRQGRWCPECKSGLSERICREFFEQLFDAKFPKSRPKWLVNSDGNRMELDGFCQSLGLAFEHQGEQHYSTKTHYVSSKRRLAKRQADDRDKLYLCKRNGVTLIVVPEINYRLPVDSVQVLIKTECERLGFPLPASFDEIEVDPSPAYASSGARRFLAELREMARQRQGRLLST